MRSINLLIKSPEIQNSIDNKNIDGLYGTFSPFISEQADENNKLTDPN
jgi:hypothetical protein